MHAITHSTFNRIIATLAAALASQNFQKVPFLKMCAHSNASDAGTRTVARINCGTQLHPPAFRTTTNSTCARFISSPPSTSPAL